MLPFPTTVRRIKEILKVKGFQVSPAKLEGHLLSHPDVSDAAVVGVLDEYAGELPVAFVVLSPSAAAGIKDSREAAKSLQAGIKKVRFYKSHSTHESGSDTLCPIP